MAQLVGKEPEDGASFEAVEPGLSRREGQLHRGDGGSPRRVSGTPEEQWEKR